MDVSDAVTVLREPSRLKKPEWWYRDCWESANQLLDGQL